MAITCRVNLQISGHPKLNISPLQVGTLIPQFVGFLSLMIYHDIPTPHRLDKAIAMISDIPILYFMGLINQQISLEPPQSWSPSTPSKLFFISASWRTTTSSRKPAGSKPSGYISECCVYIHIYIYIHTVCIYIYTLYMGYSYIVIYIIS